MSKEQTTESTTETTAMHDAMMDAAAELVTAEEHNAVDMETGESFAYDANNAALVLRGTAIDIVIHDFGMSEKPQWLTRLAQQIAQMAQNVRIYAEDTIEDMQSKAKDNMDDRNHNGDRVDNTSGELPGLTPNQEIFMDSLEEDLDICADLHADAENWFETHNESDNGKLLWRNDHEVRVQKMKRQAAKGEADVKQQREAREFRKQQREARRQQVSH